MDTSLIIIQPTPFCNINCSYCYLPNRNAKTRMDLASIEAAFKNILSFPTVSDQLTIVWHAGEPMVLGTDYYRAAFAAIEAVRPAHVNLTHSFQTNGTLVTDAWCTLIKEWRIQVGVSVDGPQAINDLARRTRRGAGTFESVMKGIERLRHHGIDFYIISVLTKAALKDPDAMFAFFRENDLRDVGFNIEELEGANTDSDLATLHSGHVTRFLNRFKDLMVDTGFIMNVREIDEIIASLEFLDPRGPDNNLTKPLGILTIDVAGDVYTFSPELVGFSSPDFAGFSIGNILLNSFEELTASPRLAVMNEQIQAGVELCRRECDYFRVCGGGTPSNKLFENGTFVSSETMHCRLTKQEVTNFVLGLIEEKSR